MVSRSDTPWEEYGGAKWAHYRDLPQGEMDVEGVDGWSERFSAWWQVSDLFGSETISTTVVEIGPGEATPMHSHEPPVEEYYVVLEGTVDLEVRDPDTGEVELVEGATPGTVAYFPPGVEHRPANNYDEPSVELGFRRLEGSVDAARGSIAVDGADRERASTDREARWSHYRDLPQSDFEHREGDWSERFSAWWQVSDLFGSETVSTTVVEIGPGEATPMHAHEPPVEEYYAVLEGTVDLEVRDPETGDVAVVEGATPGTVAYFPPGVEHRPVNNYDEPSVEIGWRSLAGEVEALGENIDYSHE